MLEFGDQHPTEMYWHFLSTGLPNSPHFCSES